MIAPGDPGRIYAVLGNSLFTRELNAIAWTRGSDFGLGEYADTYPWFVIDPSNPDRVIVGVKSKYGGMGSFSILQESEDAGQTWSNDFKAIYETLSKGGFMAVLSLGTPFDLNHLIVDPSNAMNVYAVGARGVIKSVDGGKTWKEYQDGFSIPIVRSLFKPSGSDWVFAGTPVDCLFRRMVGRRGRTVIYGYSLAKTLGAN